MRMSGKRAKQWRQGFLIGLLLLVAIWLGVLIFELAGKAHIAVKEAHEAKWQYEELQARKQTLESDLETLATSRGQDAAIRRAFGVARPGEEVIVVVPPSGDSATSTNPWWKRILGWF